jgi:hypothetical protein
VITFIRKHFELDGIVQRELDRSTTVQRKGGSQVIIPTIGGTSFVSIYSSLDTSQ